MTGPELSPVPREVRAYQGETAGVVTRMVANIVDALIVGVMVGACYLGLVSITFLLDPRSFTWPDGHFLAGLTFTLSLSVVYLWLSWWLLGRSYGKHVMGIRVAGRRGRRLGPARALGRAAFCVFFPIGFFWCVISPRRHSIQDLAVYSAVVYDWMPHAALAGAALPSAPAAAGTGAPPVLTDAADAADAAGGASAADAGLPEAKVASRRYRWARAVDPYED